MLTSENDILLHRVERSVRASRFLGARLRPGTGKPRTSGVGDAMLLDFGNGFFAVADSPERDLSGSRKFLLRFSRMLEGFDALSSGSIHSDVSFTSIQAKLIAEAEVLLRTSKSICTFTGILLVLTKSGMKGIVLHMGDSFMIRVDIAGDQMERLTRDNFWMVGRSDQLYQVECIDIHGSTRLLLATDGFGGLTIPADERNELVLRLFKQYPVDAIPDILFEQYGSQDTECDDLAVMAIDPAAISRWDFRIITGGTTSSQEEQVQKKMNSAKGESGYTRAGDLAMDNNMQVMYTDIKANP